MTDSHVPTHNRTGGDGREWPKDGQQPSSTGVGEWWWYELCTVKKNPTGEVWFSPPSFLCVHLFNTANMNWIRLFVFLYFAPLPLFIFLVRNGQSQPLLCLWHILYEYFEFHLQKNQQLMCMLLCIESYICICMFFFLFFFSHYAEFWYCISSVNFYRMRALFVRSDRIRWTCSTCFYPDVDRSSAVGAAAVVGAVGGSRAETKTRKKCQRSHSGQGGVASHS